MRISEPMKTSFLVSDLNRTMTRIVEQEAHISSGRRIHNPSDDPEGTSRLRLAVMDSTAVSLCMENKLPILVLDLWDPKALSDAISGKEVGTLIGD